MRQRELAQWVGCSQTRVSEVLSGRDVMNGANHNVPKIPPEVEARRTKLGPNATARDIFHARLEGIILANVARDSKSIATEVGCREAGCLLGFSRGRRWTTPQIAWDESITMPSTTTSSAAKKTKPKTNSHQKFLLVRQRPEVTNGDASYTVLVAGKPLVVAGHKWHKVPGEIGETLRTVGMSDFVGSRHGERAFCPRFDVLTEREHERLVRERRAELSLEAQQDATRAAEDAISSRLAAHEVELGSAVVVEAR